MSFRSSAQPSRAPTWTGRIIGKSGLAKTTFWWLGLVALFIGLVTSWLHTIRAIIHDYNPIPYMDYWRIVQYFDRYKALDFSVLWIQHNEHRIVFPEMIYAADMLLFHGRQWLPLAANFVCYFSVWLVLSATLRSDKSLSPLVRGAGILLSGIIIGWRGCTVVVGSAFLLQWTMLQLAVTLGLFLLTQLKENEGLSPLIGTVACGVVATYSSGNGMLLWPILILGALLLRLARTRILFLIIAAAISILLYFVGYHSSSSLDLLAMVKHPLYLAGFIASYLSMPFGEIGTSQLAVIIGCGNLLLFFFTVFVVTRQRLYTSKAVIVFLGSFLFTLVSGILTAAGRMNLTDEHFVYAKVARYVSLPLVNWAVLFLSLIWLSSRRKWRVFSPGKLLFLASTILFLVFPKLAPWTQANDNAIADQQAATLSLESGLFDPGIIRRQVFIVPGFVETNLLTLKRNHLSIYWNDSKVRWVGRPAKEEFPGAWKENVTGRLVQILPVVGGVEVTGTELGLRRGTTLVLVDGRGTIIGLGEKLPAGTPAIFASAAVAVRQDWVGFLNANYGSKIFSAYTVSGHSLTRITSAIAVPQVQQTTSTDVGSPTPGITWQSTHWKLGVLPPGVDAGPNPSGIFWSSWNGNDASIGRIVSSDIGVPKNKCIILPVLHGPSIYGLAAQVTNSQTGQVLAEIPMQNGDTRWTLWKVPINPGVVSIKLVGRDDGTGWGQWLALGEPRQCH